MQCANTHNYTNHWYTRVQNIGKLTNIFIQSIAKKHAHKTTNNSTTACMLEISEHSHHWDVVTRLVSQPSLMVWQCLSHSPYSREARNWWGVEKTCRQERKIGQHHHCQFHQNVGEKSGLRRALLEPSSDSSHLLSKWGQELWSSSLVIDEEEEQQQQPSQ